jgi:biotin transport system substrate-specific component
MKEHFKMESKSKLQVRDMTLIAMFTALSAVGGFLKIPTPIVPITLQVVFTTMAGLVLGKKKGALSVALYIILGLIGLPIFTKGGGIQYIFESTFGYLIGFAVGAYITGAIAHSKENPSLIRLIVASVVNLIVVYIIGSIYGYVILNYVNHLEYGVKAVIGAFVTPFILKDFILMILTSVFASKLLPILKKQFNIDPYSHKNTTTLEA